jgi:hypothetical protein
MPTARDSASDPETWPPKGDHGLLRIQGGVPLWRIRGDGKIPTGGIVNKRTHIPTNLHLPSSYASLILMSIQGFCRSSRSDVNTLAGTCSSKYKIEALSIGTLINQGRIGHKWESWVSFGVQINKSMATRVCPERFLQQRWILRSGVPTWE